VLKAQYVLRCVLQRDLGYSSALVSREAVGPVRMRTGVPTLLWQLHDTLHSHSGAMGRGPVRRRALCGLR